MAGRTREISAKTAPAIVLSRPHLPETSSIVRTFFNSVHAQHAGQSEFFTGFPGNRGFDLDKKDVFLEPFVGINLWYRNIIFGRLGLVIFAEGKSFW